MTILKQVLEKLEHDGRCTAIPFKVIAFSSNGNDQWSTFDYDENLIGWLLGVWAKRCVDDNSKSISFIKIDNKLTVHKNF